MSTYNLENFGLNKFDRAIEVARHLGNFKSLLISLQEVGNDFKIGEPFSEAVKKEGHQSSKVILDEIIRHMEGGPQKWGYIYEGFNRADQLVGSNHGGYSHRNAILYDKTTVVPIGDMNKEVVLTGCAAVPAGPCRLEIAIDGKNPLILPFKLKNYPNEVFAMINVHLPKSEVAAKTQLGQIHQFLEKSTGFHYVIAGDFNLDHKNKNLAESPEFKAILELRNTEMPEMYENKVLKGHKTDIDHIWFVSSTKEAKAFPTKPESHKDAKLDAESFKWLPRVLDPVSEHPSTRLSDHKLTSTRFGLATTKFGEKMQFKRALELVATTGELPELITFSDEYKDRLKQAALSTRAEHLNQVRLTGIIPDGVFGVDFQRELESEKFKYDQRHSLTISTSFDAKQFFKNARQGTIPDNFDPNILSASDRKKYEKVVRKIAPSPFTQTVLRPSGSTSREVVAPKFIR